MPSTIESELRKLQATVRQRSDERSVMSRRPPAELRDGAPSHIVYPQAVADQVQIVVDSLLADPRFEYLADAERTVWDFAAYCYLRRGQSQVQNFMREQARPPTTQTCYVSLEYLSVEQPIALHAVEVLPLADSRIPDIEALKLQADRLDSIAAVAVTGTHLVKMANRARALIGHELRLLQVGLRTSTGAADSQLRFRVGTTYMFDSGAHGWNRAPGASDVLPLNQHLLDLAQEHAVWKLPATAGNDLERRVQVALDWLDRARFVVEPVVQLLYLFFALEALLGDTAEGLKADSLAFRQMTLNAIMTDSFDHPAVTWGLYAGARSAAVHGEELTELDARTVEQFGASVRETLGHYLTLAGQHGLTKRSRLLETLRQCPERQELANWLLLHGGSGWRPYLASIGLAEAQPGPEPTDGSVGAEGDA